MAIVIKKTNRLLLRAGSIIGIIILAIVGSGGKGVSDMDSLNETMISAFGNAPSALAAIPVDSGGEGCACGSGGTGGCASGGGTGGNGD